MSTHDGQRRDAGARIAAAVVYVVILIAAFAEQWGSTTNDTKTPVIEAPGRFLAATLSLWSPQYSLGEVQNQAYGYLFPQGLFYWLAQVVHIPPWAAERLWSVLLLVVGCEGARLLARSMGLTSWPALAAGFAYGLAPRVVAQIGVRSAEVLPGLVLPWVLLPIVLAINGRLTARSAALLSAGAFMFSGAVNGTATVAPLPLVGIVLLWALGRRLVGWNLIGWWTTFVVASNLWWVASLLTLNRYAPRFFDYVEDARNTTSTTGFFPSLRGMPNWVNYILLGSEPNWPAGWALAYDPILVLLTVVVALIGLIGLVRWDNGWRVPLIVSALVGLVLLTVGHDGLWSSPLAAPIRDVLDGPLALLRNVHKFEPVVRLPLALGFGAALHHLLASRVVRRRSWGRPVLVAGAIVLAVASAQPIIAMNLRTPGWKSIPSYWQETASYLAAQPGTSRAWLVPGEGFAIKSWGWSVDEPMMAVGSTPWVTRSQVPLTGPETIVMLSALEDILDTGVGSASLGTMLARVGLQYVVVSHDLDPAHPDAIASNRVSIALARSGGVTRVATFGAADYGPMIEVFRVTTPAAPDLAVRPIRSVVTVAGDPADVLEAVGRGLVASDEAVLLQGDSEWREPAAVVGDAYRLRERNFGRVHEASGAVMSPDEPRHSGRLIRDYPRPPGAQPVTARYSGISYVTASTSQGFANVFGPTRPENGPFSAVDGDPLTTWRSASYIGSQAGQWLEIHLKGKRTLNRVTITSPRFEQAIQPVQSWKVEAGAKRVVVRTDPDSDTTDVDLGGVVADRIRISAAQVADQDDQRPIGIAEVGIAGLAIGRTLVVPYQNLAPDVSFMFSARPESRACLPTLLQPDCDVNRIRSSDELSAIARTITVPETGEWTFDATVLARAHPATMSLLDPDGALIKVHASSTWLDDPTVSARMAYDGATTTSWIASPLDPHPTLYVNWLKPVTIDRIRIAAPPEFAVRPTRATIRAGDETREVVLDDFATFEPIRASQVEIELSNPTVTGQPIGVAELSLPPADVSVPFDGAHPVDAPCGSGPTVELPGGSRRTRVVGVTGEVVSASPMRAVLCGPPLDLAEGENRIRIRSTDQFQVVAATLSRAESSAPVVTTATSRSMVVRETTATRETLDVGAGAEALLVTTRNFNRGWAAYLNGQPLPVQRIDGWAQGWRIPKGSGGRVTIEFTPQRLYLGFLVGGGAVAVVILLAAAVTLVRNRRAGLGGPAIAVAATSGMHRRGRWFALTVVMSAVAWLVAGGTGVIGVGVAAMVRYRAWIAQTLGVALVLAAGVWVVIGLADGPRTVPPGADLLAGIGAAMIFAAAIWANGRR